MVLVIVCTSVSRQFPASLPVFYPGEKMTAVEPFPSVSAMWQAHEMYATNNKPAINGEKTFTSTSPGGHTTFSSSPPPSSPAQQTRLRSHSHQSHQGSQRNPFVMNVHTSPDTDPDPLTLGYNHWPLEHSMKCTWCLPCFQPLTHLSGVRSLLLIPERPLSAYGVTYASTAADRTPASNLARAPVYTSQVFSTPG